MVTSTVMYKSCTTAYNLEIFTFFSGFSDHELEIFNKALQLRLRTPTPQKTDHINHYLNWQELLKTDQFADYFFFNGALFDVTQPRLISQFYGFFRAVVSTNVPRLSFNSIQSSKPRFSTNWFEFFFCTLLFVNLPRGMSRDLVLFMRTLTNLTSDDIWFTFFIRRKQSREKLPKLHFLEQNIWKTPWRQP